MPLSALPAVTIQAPCRLWHRHWPEYRRFIRILIHHTLQHAPFSHTVHAITVRLSRDSEVRALNSRFRGRDKPTNVLSFPSHPTDGGGDMILAFETVHREAQAQGKPFAHHSAHLVVHGALHLLHYDHATASDAARMEGLETRLLADHAIPNPYDCRHP